MNSPTRRTTNKEKRYGDSCRQKLSELADLPLSLDDPSPHFLTIASDESGAVFLGGTFSLINEVWRPGLAKLKSDGTLDPGFFPRLNDYRRVFASCVAKDRQEEQQDSAASSGTPADR